MSIDRIVHSGFETEKFCYLPYKTLLEAHNAMAQTPHMIHAGTLLGAYRDGCFIQHDDDIDISVIGNWDRQMPANFTLVMTVDEGGLQYETVYRYEPTGVIVDIWNWQNYDEENYYHILNEKEALVRKDIIGKFSNIHLYRSEFPAPEHIEEFLEVWYGDWRTPCEDKKKVFRERLCNESSF